MKKLILNQLSENFFWTLLICWVLSLVPLSAMNVNEEEQAGTQQALPKMKFKLGFEFQEGSGLCPWALNNFHVQKKELFSLNDETNKKKLWHVVIDGIDIEFVTVPFAYTERLFLRECIETIVESVNALKTLAGTQIPFIVWVEALKERYKTRISELKVVQDQLISIMEDWIPIFAPQATIQHPLEYSIFLYFGLFGFKNPAATMPLVDSLPCRNSCIAYHEDGNSEEVDGLFRKYLTKMSGLVFLHALTLTQMTPVKDCSDSEHMEETLFVLNRFQQVDPKMRLKLMSRRPFSAMLKDLCFKANIPPGRYLEFFMQLMSDNLSFRSVLEMFHCANYGEQFFDEETGKPKSLRFLMNRFQEDFVERNRVVLIQLLDSGVINTTMLRYIKPEYDLFKIASLLTNQNRRSEYFVRVFKSIAFPEERYKLEVREESGTLIEREVCEFDSLSPPWFLNLDNSMGAFKNEMTQEEKEYGEAIIEVRGIKGVEKWFLKKAGLSIESRDDFLTRCDTHLIFEVCALFDFLNNFITEENLSDIKVGMTHSIYRH